MLTIVEPSVTLRCIILTLKFLSLFIVPIIGLDIRGNIPVATLFILSTIVTTVGHILSVVSAFKDLGALDGMELNI